jgi:8-oxo-dGTP pyrophosphatase MutT (NUDIX family)
MKQGSLKKVQVWIHARDERSGEHRVLLLQTTPERKSIWQPVTGGVEPGEDQDQAAYREGREETGFNGDLGTPKALGFEFFFRGARGPVEERCYSWELPSCLEPILDSREHVAHAWVSLEEARVRIPFDSQLQALRLLTEGLARGAPFKNWLR